MLFGNQTVSKPGDIFSGLGYSGFAGDGGPAVDAQLTIVRGLAFDEENNLYIADDGNRRLRRVDNSGVITTVAGGGTLLTDNIPALQKNLRSVTDVASAGRGNPYFLPYFSALDIGQAVS